MKRLYLVLFLVLLASPAAADPISAIVAAVSSFFAGGSVLATLASALLRSLVKAGISLLVAKLRKRKQKTPGIQSTHTTSGGTEPQATVLGRFATRGHLVYQCSYHENNKWLAHVVELGDLPGATLRNLILDGVYADLGPVDSLGLRPILSKTENGIPYGYIAFFDGTQTTAHNHLVSWRGGAADRPWTSDHILTGTCYAVLYFYRRDHLYPSGVPRYAFELDGPPLYDIRKDSTVGGNGSHRFNDPASWDQTTNPLVIAYNVLRGIALPGGDIWGGGFPAEDLPYTEWAEAMDACDQLVAGTGRTQFEAGFEVKFEEAPADFLEELFSAANAQIVETGGYWYPIVGSATVASATISDDDVLISQAWQHDPFPGLENTFNAVTTTYTSPASLWEASTLETIVKDEWVAEDGRQKLFELNLPMVYIAEQARQLTDALLRENRRFRTHRLPLPGEYARLRPLQNVHLSLQDYGYDAKTFRITEAAYDLQTLNVSLSLRETDPADFDPDPGLELPETPHPTGPIPVTDAGVVGLAVAGETITAADGKAHAPAIRIVWDGRLSDTCTGLTFQIRVQGRPEAEADTVSTTNVAGGNYRHHPVQPAGDYEVRGKAIAPTRLTEWSAWLPVTTPDVRPGLDDLADEVGEAIDTVQANLNTAVTSLTVDYNAAQQAAQDAETAADAAALARDSAASHAAASDADRSLAEQAAANAQGSASAAASSASAASSSATDATQDASAANADRLAAQTARSGAESARDASVAAQNSASGSASAAASSASLAANAEGNAQQAATAAANSASSAAASETAAGTSASAAETSSISAAASANSAADDEAAAAGHASDARNSELNAATSEANAAGSAASASTSQEVAARSELAASALASGNLLTDPSFGFSNVNDAWENSLGGVASYVTHGQSLPSNPKALRISQGSSANAGAYAKNYHDRDDWVGRTLRVVAKIRASRTGLNVYRSGLLLRSADDTRAFETDIYPPITTEFQAFSHDMLLTDNVARDRMRMRWYFTGGTGNDWIEVTDISVTDVTEVIAAGASASAAASSASAASTSATDAAQEATSAQSERVSAETAASAALVSQLAAASSATSAENSETAAVLAQTVAVRARNAAQAHATGNLIPDPAFDEEDCVSSLRGVLSYITHGQVGTISPKSVRSASTTDYPTDAGVYLGRTSLNAPPGPWAGKTLRLSGKIRTSSVGMNLSVGIAFFSETGPLLTTVYESITPTTGFSEFATEVTVPASETDYIYAQGRVFFQAATGGTQWLEVVDPFLEDVTVAAETGIIQAALADLEGNASASITMRAQAGTGGATLELVAADDPTGPTSAARISADNILLDGTVQAQHIGVTSLSALVAEIGHFKSAASGERVEIEDDRIRVFDGNNVPRVVIGRLD
ncbi:phage tail protein [Epibacterium sp. DP7N7-1]|nr:phage tail protein [Epibacterium sp. DP7N7-1]